MARLQRLRAQPIHACSLHLWKMNTSAILGREWGVAHSTLVPLYQARGNGVISLMHDPGVDSGNMPSV